MKPDTILDAVTPDVMAKVVSRRDALANAGRATAAVALASVPVALSVMARSAFGQGSALPQAVKDVLNFALTLEYLENEFYATGLAASSLIPAQYLPVFQQIGKHESDHVALLQATLGADAVTKPTFDFTAGGAFGDVFSHFQTFAALAQGFEDTGVRAYKGQAGALIDSDAYLTVALQIHSVEARHASKVRRIRGQKGWIVQATTDVPALQAVYAGEDAANDGFTDAAATEAFDEPLTKDAVLSIAGQFIVP